MNASRFQIRKALDGHTESGNPLRELQLMRKASPCSPKRVPAALVRVLWQTRESGSGRQAWSFSRDATGQGCVFDPSFSCAEKHRIGAEKKCRIFQRCAGGSTGTPAGPDGRFPGGPFRSEGAASHASHRIQQSTKSTDPGNIRASSLLRTSISGAAMSLEETKLARGKKEGRSNGTTKEVEEAEIAAPSTCSWKHSRSTDIRWLVRLQSQYPQQRHCRQSMQRRSTRWRVACGPATGKRSCVDRIPICFCTGPFFFVPEG